MVGCRTFSWSHPRKLLSAQVYQHMLSSLPLLLYQAAVEMSIETLIILTSSLYCFLKIV